MNFLYLIKNDIFFLNMIIFFIIDYQNKISINLYNIEILSAYFFSYNKTKIFSLIKSIYLTPHSKNFLDN